MTTLETASGDRVEESSRTDERFSHRAMLGAVVSGFTIGVIITLAAYPLLTNHSKKSGNGQSPLPTPVVMSAAQVRTNIRDLSDQALVLSPLGKHRLLSVSLVADVDQSQYLQGPRMYDARIRFTLNPNPVSSHIQVGSAESDCFLLLKNLYSHDLPLQNIELIGTFPHEGRLATGLRAGSGLFVESKFAPWKSLSRTETKAVWTNLSPH